MRTSKFKLCFNCEVLLSGYGLIYVKEVVPAFGPLRGPRCRDVRIRSKSTKKPQHDGTPRPRLVELLIGIFRVKLGREHLERDHARHLQLSATEAVLALRAPSFAYEWLYYFSEAHSTPRLREPPPDDLSAIRFQSHGTELPAVVFRI